MARHHVFNFIWKHVEARDENHVLLAVDDLYLAGRIHHADVARFEVAVRCHHLCRLVGTLPIARHHLRAARTNLAWLTEGYLSAFIVTNLDQGRRSWQDDGTGVLIVVGTIDGERRGSLR